VPAACPPKTRKSIHLSTGDPLWICMGCDPDGRGLLNSTFLDTTRFKRLQPHPSLMPGACILSPDLLLRPAAVKQGRDVPAGVHFTRHGATLESLETRWP